MGEPARIVRSLNFEGLDIERLRVALQAVNATCGEPKRLGDRVKIEVEAEVERIEHYGTPLTRRHILKVIEAKVT